MTMDPRSLVTSDQFLRPNKFAGKKSDRDHIARLLRNYHSVHIIFPVIRSQIVQMRALLAENAY